MDAQHKKMDKGTHHEIAKTVDRSTISVECWRRLSDIVRLLALWELCACISKCVCFMDSRVGKPHSRTLGHSDRAYLTPSVALRFASLQPHRREMGFAFESSCELNANKDQQNPLHCRSDEFPCQSTTISPEYAQRTDRVWRRTGRRRATEGTSTSSTASIEHRASRSAEEAYQSNRRSPDDTTPREIDGQRAQRRPRSNGTHVRRIASPTATRHASMGQDR